MPKYVVYVREVHIQPYAVIADSVEKAIENVNNHGGIMIEEWFEYSHSLEPDHWTVEEVTDDSLSGYFDECEDDEDE